jgi:double-stranded uracil-DNA glycosylase
MMRGAAEDRPERGAGATVPDVVAPGLAVLFCGINPGLLTAATGHHFARPGNRFWPALHAAGFTPRRLAPAEQALLPGFGCGITNVVARATASAAELRPEELRAGARALEENLLRWRPRWLAVLGLGAYRTAFGRAGAGPGLQDHRIGGTRVWVLPNPSGLNASYRPADFARLFGELRAAVLAEPGGRAAGTELA